MRDRLLACLLAGLFSYMLLLQGVVSAYALTSMAADDLGPNFVICTPSGLDATHINHPLADIAHECCSSVCQLACAVGPAAAPTSLVVALERISVATTQPEHVAPITAPAELGLSSEARAPPAFS